MQLLGCTDGWSYFAANKMCYRFYEDNIGWEEAEEFCQRNISDHVEGNLASVPDNETNTFISALMDTKVELQMKVCEDFTITVKAPIKNLC